MIVVLTTKNIVNAENNYGNASSFDLFSVHHINPIILRIEQKARKIARFIKENDLWVTDIQTGSLLNHLASNKKCLDIGSFTGFSSYCMALTADLVHAFDAHSYDDKCWKDSDVAHKITELPGSCGTSFIPFRSHYYHCPKRDTIYEVRAKPPTTYDLIFIDSSHEPENWLNEVLYYYQFLNTDGIIICHDWHWIQNEQFGLPHEIITFTSTKKITGNIDKYEQSILIARK